MVAVLEVVIDVVDDNKIVALPDLVANHPLDLEFSTTLSPKSTLSRPAQTMQRLSVTRATAALQITSRIVGTSDIRPIAWTSTWMASMVSLLLYL